MKYKRILKITTFLILLMFISNVGLNTVRNKNAHNREYMDDLSNADVLVLGSSHAYNNLNASVLWKEYGITSACIGQGEQPISMSYYALKSALTYHKPKVVVLEVYMAVGGNEHDEKPDHYVRALLDYPIWRNLGSRIEASELLSLDFGKRLEYILGFPVYHNDYTTNEYFAEQPYTAGFNYMFGRNEEGQRLDRCSVDTVKKRSELGSYAEEYLIKIAELCQEENIELVFLVTPFQAKENLITYINTVADMAKEMNIPFVDMNCHTYEIGIDLNHEMCDWGHALITGSDKNSRWLGAYLNENYQLPDRRGDAAYDNWNQVYNEYYQIKMNYIKNNAIKSSDWLREIFYDDLLFYGVWVKDESVIYEDRQTQQLLTDVLENDPEMAFMQGIFSYSGGMDETQIAVIKKCIKEQLQTNPQAEMLVVVIEKNSGEIIDQTIFSNLGIGMDEE